MKKNPHKQSTVQEGQPNRATYHPGSTTQGGSNFGQGSMHLGKNANRQGSEKNSGSNYDNEQGWNNEALRMEDIHPGWSYINHQAEEGPHWGGDYGQ